MQNKKTSAVLAALFLLPWGMQCLVNNFLPIYVAALPFATEKTVGLVTGIGSVITLISQMVWASFADRSKRKSRVLFLSLIIVAAASVLFLALPVKNVAVLLVLTVLFYSSYMTHQPLIDTIGAEQCVNTKHTFSWFRSFASLGYGAMELLFILLPHDSESIIFLYIAILAFVSAGISLLVNDKSAGAQTQENQQKAEKLILSAPLVKYLVFSFLLFVCGSAITTFFPVYFTAENGLKGDVGLFSLIAGIATFLEWGIMLVFSKKISRLKPQTAFLFISLATVMRGAVLYFAPNPYFAAVIIPFHALWFGLIWSVATPYLKQIVPEDMLVRAQGIWTVVAFGVAPFIGSFLGGEIAERIGTKTLFLFVSLLGCVLAITSGWFFSGKKVDK